MVGKRKSPEATIDPRLAALYEALRHEPARFEQIEKLLEDISYRRGDLATNIERVSNLLKDHRILQLGLLDILPYEARTIISWRTYEEYDAFLESVKEAFKGVRGKYTDFLKTAYHHSLHRDEDALYFPRLEEMMKDHRNLLPGFNAFVATHRKITIPLTDKAAREFLYIAHVKDTFHLEPARYTEFMNILNDYRAHRFDVVSLVARVDELMEDYPELLSDFVVFLPAEAEETTHPQFVKRIKEVLQDEPANYKEFKKILRARRVQRKNPRAYNLVAKVKERFQGDDIHVYKSFLQIVRKLREGNMSSDEVHHEIATLLKDHTDLVLAVSDFFNKPSTSTTSAS